MLRKPISPFPMRCDHCRKAFRIAGGLLVDKDGASPIMAFETIQQNGATRVSGVNFLCSGRCDGRVRERSRFDPGFGSGSVEVALWSDLNALRIPANRERMAREVATMEEAGVVIIHPECLAALRGLYAWLKQKPLENYDCRIVRKHVLSGDLSAPRDA